MNINFWGVRGSIPTPGPETAAVGGNTSCVEVRCGSTRIILDAGSGIRKLGNQMMSEGLPIETTLLLSHVHWDHIQGLPFFTPAYIPSTHLTIAGGPNGVMSLRETLVHQMTAPVFPVRLDELGCRLDVHEMKPGEAFHVGPVRVLSTKGNHPGGVMVYRLESGGRSVVYATDVEHYSCVDQNLVNLARGADVLIYDSMYTPEEYAGERGRSRVGWGHSTFAAGAALALAAGVSKLVLFHHDPAHDDAAVNEIERRAREVFPDVVAAREGQGIELLPVAWAA
ncbi:MAG: MBL fold metallo-hydrolase [Polyangiaceae bacterium]